MTETFLICNGNCNNISYFTAFFGDKMQICHICALNNGKAWGRRSEGIWEIPEPFVWVCCEPETALTVHFKKVSSVI